MCLGKIAVIFPKIFPKHTPAHVMKTSLVKIDLSISKFYTKCTHYFNSLHEIRSTCSSSLTLEVHV